MNKIVKAFVLLFFFSELLYAQNYDHIWVHRSNGTDSILDIPHYSTILNFTNSPPTMQKLHVPYPSFAARGAMCNAGGKFMYDSNGFAIYNQNGTILENGDSLATNSFIANNYPGIPIERIMTNIPRPGYPDDYFLLIRYSNLDFYKSNHKMMLALITKGSDPNLKKVLFKNKIIYDGKWIDLFNLTKHANGRDWWLVFSDVDVVQKTRTYKSVLIQSDTAFVAQSQELSGYEPIPDNPGYITTFFRLFSPDGSWFISLDYKNGVRIHRFDRCSGLLSPMVVNLPYNYFPAPGGIAISPNSRFLYVANELVILQYDLQAADIVASKDTIGIFDGFTTPYSAQPRFGLFQLGPDGKIYDFSSEGYVHYIARPNNKGLACDFRQRGFKMPTPANGLPFYPNYRLGPLDGTLCDSLGLNNLPIADFWWFGDSTLSVHFEDNSTYEPTQWHWDFGDGAVSQDTSPTHLYAQKGVYTVCLTVQNLYASNTICKEVSISNYVDANEPDIHDKILVYPNPAWDEITVEYSSDFNGSEFALYDLAGKLLKTQVLSTSKGRMQINIQDLPAGLFFYTLRNSAGFRTAGKICKN
jgi:hypothetical protein